MKKVNEELVKSRRHEVLKNLSKKKEDSDSIFRGDHRDVCIGIVSMRTQED